MHRAHRPANKRQEGLFDPVPCQSFETYLAIVRLDFLMIEDSSNVFHKRIFSCLTKMSFSPIKPNNVAHTRHAVNLFISVCLCVVGLSVLSFTTAHTDTATPQPSPPIRVGIYENKPMVYIDESGNRAGLFPDLLDSIALKEGWRLKYVRGTWSECLDRLEKKQIDIMMDVAETEQRGLRFLFNNETVFVNWEGVYSTRNTTINSLANLKGREIAIMKDSARTEGGVNIQNLMAALDIPCTFVEVDTYDKVFKLLSQNEVTAGIVSRIFGSLFAEQYAVKGTSIIFNKRHLKFAFSKNQPLSSTLIADIDRNLVLQKEDPNSIYNRALFVYLSGLPREMIFSDPP
jgi:ABC-type amino acid transport substrate-binding protein